MDINNSYQAMKNKYSNLVVALGNFDGVHKGHRRLLARLVEKARQLGGTPAVFTFSPHPLKVINPEIAPPLLLSADDKKDIMESLGVKVLFCIPFTREFMSFTPEDFVQKVLIDELNIKGLLVGYNYSFGQGGRGTPEQLRQFAHRFKFELEVIPPVVIDGQTVSSTLIRGLLLNGRVAEAANFLGYQPFMKGMVVNGEKRGRQIGFPTANLDYPEDLVVPETGVYAVLVYIGDKSYQGIANIGYKPTFQREKMLKNVEVNIFNFAGDIYDREIKVKFFYRIRAEVKFANVEQLVAQIKSDKVRAINFFQKNMAKPQ